MYIKQSPHNAYQYHTPLIEDNKYSMTSLLGMKLWRYWMCYSGTIS